MENMTMHSRTIATALMLTACTSVTALAQTFDPSSMKTPDGQPDISGRFTFRTLTPLQRPQALEGKSALDAEEAAQFEASERIRLNRDLFDPESGAPSAGYQPRADGGVLSYNEFWYERGIELVADKRTSLIIDPPNGRLPEQTPAARRRATARRAYVNEHRYDSYENRSLFDRCIMGFNAGPPMVSATYNNNVMIFQAPGYVTILNEMVHNARVIPIGNNTEKPPFVQYSGVSRGHYEGNTLVVETTQFRGGQSRGTGPNMHLIERFTRLDPDTVAYEFTVTDNTVYTAPYTALMPLRRTDDDLFEYACHEGNIGMHGILAGARKLESEGRELRR